MLVLAYADWCGHCKTFKPIWNQFKAKYGAILDIREVNADQGPEIIKNMGIRGFPTVVFLMNGEKHEFNGGRDQASLEKFVKGIINPHVNNKLSTYRSNTST